VKATAEQLSYVDRAGVPSDLRVFPPASQPQSSSGALASTSPRRRRVHRSHGIEVHEDELGSVSAQCLYRMRCECGRAWFELELPKLVQCPACLRLNVVTL
jgi:hypothetical protein